MSSENVLLGMIDGAPQMENHSPSYGIDRAIDQAILEVRQNMELVTWRLSSNYQQCDLFVKDTNKVVAEVAAILSSRSFKRTIEGALGACLKNRVVGGAYTEFDDYYTSKAAKALLASVPKVLMQVTDADMRKAAARVERVYQRWKAVGFDNAFMNMGFDTWTTRTIVRHLIRDLTCFVSGRLIGKAGKAIHKSVTAAAEAPDDELGATELLTGRDYWV